MPLATNTSLRLEVSVPSQSNAPPSMSGSVLTLGAAHVDHEAEAVIVAVIEPCARTTGVVARMAAATRSPSGARSGVARTLQCAVGKRVAVPLQPIQRGQMGRDVLDERCLTTNVVILPLASPRTRGRRCESAAAKPGSLRGPPGRGRSDAGGEADARTGPSQAPRAFEREHVGGIGDDFGAAQRRNDLVLAREADDRADPERRERGELDGLERRRGREQMLSARSSCADRHTRAGRTGRAPTAARGPPATRCPARRAKHVEEQRPDLRSRQPLRESGMSGGVETGGGPGAFRGSHVQGFRSARIS